MENKPYNFIINVKFYLVLLILLVVALSPATAMSVMAIHQQGRQPQKH